MRDYDKIDELESNWNDVIGEKFSHLKKRHKIKTDEVWELFNVFSNKELNICDRCGVIENSFELFWVDNPFYEPINEAEEKRIEKFIGKYSSVCADCKEILWKGID